MTRSEDAKNYEQAWLEGYYPPDIDKAGGWDRWRGEWSMGPHADADWIWFPGDYYTEASARKRLADS